MKNIVVLLIIGIIGYFLFFNSSSSKTSTVTVPSRINYTYNDYGEDEERTIYRDDAISDYWDDIKEYVDGTETIEACYDGNGNCYDLEADISDGMITTIYFDNGGNLDFYADLDENGYASDSDKEGNGWEFTFDMDSSIVDTAVEDWASDNDYILE